MTHRTTADTTPVADGLLERFRELKNSSLFERGEAAMRLAAETIVALRELERRVVALEERDHAEET